MLPLYLMKPSFLNLFIKKLTRDRVVPIISASVSMRELRIDWQQDLVTVGGEFDGVFNPLASTEQMNRRLHSLKANARQEVSGPVVRLALRPSDSCHLARF